MERLMRFLNVIPHDEKLGQINSLSLEYQRKQRNATEDRRSPLSHFCCLENGLHE